MLYGVCGFGDGFATRTLPVYLIAIGDEPVRIGLVVAASLLGAAVPTLAIGAIASRQDLRTLMLLGAVLMILNGLAFPISRLWGNVQLARTAGRYKSRQVA